MNVYKVFGIKFQFNFVVIWQICLSFAKFIKLEYFKDAVSNVIKFYIQLHTSFTFNGRQIRVKNKISPYVCFPIIIYLFLSLNKYPGKRIYHELFTYSLWILLYEHTWYMIWSSFYSQEKVQKGGIDQCQTWAQPVELTLPVKLSLPVEM